MPYQRLSEKHKAFTSNVSYLFIPRIIEKALGHSELRLAAFSINECSSEKKTWEIVDVPK